MRFTGRLLRAVHVDVRAAADDEVEVETLEEADQRDAPEAAAEEKGHVGFFWPGFRVGRVKSAAAAILA